ncbi:response regulator [candidate division WOR-3 bacterium]|nr:response regulator [candidate division WOR-3 bacterium]
MQEKQTVLLVDDNELILRTITLSLSGEDYSILTALNGREAYDIAIKEKPSLVITDLTMPEMNGIDLCKKLKSTEETKFIPVLVITAYDALVERLKAIKAGADEFLSKPFNPLELKVRIKSFLKFKEVLDKLEDVSMVIASLAKAIDARDSYTQGHNARVSFVSQKIADYFDLSKTTKSEMKEAGLLHDIGKIGIAERILQKPGSLDAKEREIIETHPVIGEEILKPLKFTPVFRAIIRSHHEKLNGSGYPDALKGDQISFPVRIISISDVFDALSTTRPYRKALTTEQVLEAIKKEVQMGFWDVEVFKALEKIAFEEEIKSVYLP